MGLREAQVTIPIFGRGLSEVGGMSVNPKKDVAEGYRPFFEFHTVFRLWLDRVIIWSETGI